MTVSYLGTDGVDRELRETWLVADNLPPFADADARQPGRGRSGLDLAPTRSAGRGRCCSRPQGVAQERPFGNSCRPPAAGGAAPTCRRRMPLVSSGPAASATAVRHVRPPAHLHLQRARPGRLRRRVRPPGRTAAAERADPRRARQRRRAHLRQRVHPADADAAADRARAGAVHCTAAEPADLPPAQRTTRPASTSAPWFPSMDQAIETGSTSPARSRSRPGTAPTRSASGTTARSCSSPTPAATRRPTSSPPASRTTGSARCSASTTTPAPAAPTSGPTACSSSCSSSRRRIRLAVQGPAEGRRTCGCPSAARCASGRLAGTPVEDLGVMPDVRHRMTPDDVLQRQRRPARPRRRAAGRPADAHARRDGHAGRRRHRRRPDRVGQP